jgi:hypothetical protein
VILPPLLTSRLSLEALAALAIAVGGFAVGVKIEGNHRDAQQLVLERSMHKAYVDQVRRSNEDVAKLKNLQVVDRNSFAALRQELTRVKRSTLASSTCPESGAPAPDVRLTADFVGLWNDAYRVGMPGDPGRASGAAERAGFAYPEDLLGNHADNAERWLECRRQLNALIDVLGQRRTP